MRPGIRVEIKKNKIDSTYSVEAYFGNDTFVCKKIGSKDDAERCRDDAKELLDKIKLSKLKATLTDVEINNLSYKRIPLSDKGIFEEMLRELLRGNFVKTAKFIRDMLFELNLNNTDYEEV